MHYKSPIEPLSFPSPFYLMGHDLVLFVYHLHLIKKSFDYLPRSKTVHCSSEVIKIINDVPCGPNEQATRTPPLTRPWAYNTHSTPK